MKYTVFFLSAMMVCTTYSIAQKPEEIHSIAQVLKPHKFFVSQAELWWKELEKDTTNEKAWYNYYKANRYAEMTYSETTGYDPGKKGKWTDEGPFLKEQNDIMDLISTSIPGTYTYYIFKKNGYHDEERYEALTKAYALEPGNPDTYDELIVYYETHSMPEKRKEFNTLWFKSNDLSAGFLAYSYNVLMSLDSGGTILTFGDVDTFPMWMLQDVMGIRQDITVLNISLLSIPEYREKMFKRLSIPALDREFPDGSTPDNQQKIIDHILGNKPQDLPLYIGLPAWKKFSEYENDLYLVGLALQYSQKNIDNLALLKNNFENRYLLDYLKHPFSFDISQGIINRNSVNYLPGIIKLYQHYRLSGDRAKAEQIKKLGLLIADKSGDEWKEKAAEILR